MRAKEPAGIRRLPMAGSVMRVARLPVRHTEAATLELNAGRRPRGNTTPTGTGKHVMTGQAAARSGLKQETIAIVAVGVTMLGTMLYTTSRLEIRMDRAVAEIRTEARADRELFTRELLRLTAEQSRLAGIVEGARTEQTQ